MLKAQVLGRQPGAGGRHKERIDAEEVEKIAKEIFASQINGLPVRKVMVAQKADIAQELYVGITVDGYRGKAVVVVSTAGGVHIEETARNAPEKIASAQIDPAPAFILTRRGRFL